MTASVPNATYFSYTGDGSTTTFSFPLRFLEDADVLVYLAGVLKSKGTHYSITGAGEANGGDVAFVTAPASGATVEIRRSTAPKQSVDLTDSGRTPGDTLERQLDRLALVGQDHEERIDDIEAITDDLTAAVDDAQADADAAAASATAAAASAATVASVANSLTFTTKAAVEAEHIAASIDVIRTAGYTTAGDGGGALYKRVVSEPSHEGKIQSADGAWWELAETVVNPFIFGALRGRANATVTTAALQAMLEFCETTGADFDLLGGSWFINGEGLSILSPVSGHGRGIGYWHSTAAAFDNGTNQVAQTQLILTGTGTNTLSPHGMSSMAVSGGVITNPSARAGWNESSYTLLNLNGSFSCGLYIGPDAAGTKLSGFRILPDGGGDDGLDLYNDTAATASSGWAADWDFGIVADSAADIKMDLIQSVGHYRMASALITAISITPSDATPKPPYRQTWSRCEFEGYRGVAIRGADTFKITGIAATYVEVAYAADHPFNHLVEDRVAFSKNSFSHTVYTFTGESVIGGTTLRLTGLNADPTASFAVGDTLVARPYGGGTSHISFTDCHIGGMKHPSGKQCHDLDLGADAMPNPGTGIEMSGARMVEIVFDQTCRIQSGEQVAIHLHECTDVQLPGLIEFNTDIDTSTRGMRIITSPLYSSNTRVTNPAGSTIRPRFGNGLSNFLNNNGDSGCIDLRPAVDIPSAAYALFTSDSGFLSAKDLIIPDLALYMSMNSAVGLRTPKAGIAGIFGPDYPTPLAKFVYDAALDYLVQYEHIKPDADLTRDLGDSTHNFRAGYIRSLNSSYVQGPIITIADDATSGNISTPRKSGFLLISHNPDTNFPNTAMMALIAYDAGTSPAVVKCSATIGANLDVTTSDVVGTTGTDGNITVSIRANNVMEIENRSGASATFSYQFIG